MGGDPTGERSAPEKMILVCNVRHKESKFAIDKETIRWDGLTPAGSNGPVSWSIDIGVFSAGMLAAGTWVEIAREESPGRLMPLTGYQLELVMHLGEQLAQKFQNSFRSS